MVWKILLVILIVLVVALIVLYILGRRLQKKQAAQEEQMVQIRGGGELLRPLRRGRLALHDAPPQREVPAL